MEHWKENNIKSLGTFFNNNIFSRDYLNYEAGLYQNVHYGDVLITFSDILDADNPLLPYINLNVKISSAVFIEDGDIIIADTAEDETVGKVCEVRNIGERKILSGLHTLWFRPKKGIFAPKYLGYLLNSFDCHKQLIRKAHGIKVLSINKSDFWKTIIKYPSEINEQQAIAGIISKVDQCIENVKKSIEAAQNLKKSLMQNLLTGRIKPDGTVRKEDEFYEHPKLGKVPIGWEVKKVGDLIKPKKGYTWQKEQELIKYEDGAIRVLTVSNIQSQLDLSVSLYLQNVAEKDKTEKKVSKDWIIAVSSNGNRNRIGNPVYIKENMDLLFASFLTGFKPKNDKELLPKFFFYWMSSSFVQQKITTVSEGTTGLGNMNIRHFKNMRIKYPELPEQQAIVGIISKVDQCIENAKKSIEATQTLKKSLMQNLLTGKIRVDVEKINSILESMK